MLGWNIAVYRVQGVNPAPADVLAADKSSEQALRKAAESPGIRIAVWQTGVNGLDWIDELVRHRCAIELPGNGYPNHFFAQARDLLPPILDGPPRARTIWGRDAGDILGPAWEGKTAVDRSAAAQCSPDEWLLVEAWDKS